MEEYNFIHEDDSQTIAIEELIEGMYNNEVSDNNN